MPKRGGVRRKKVIPLTRERKPATSINLARLLKDYETATEQYAVIVRYLKAAIEVLPKAECQVLLEFTEIAKKHCERLHRTIERRLGTDRRSA
jgi:hypothetical protein